MGIKIQKIGMPGLLQDAASVEHKRLRIPKNPTCEICQRSRMYRRRTNSKRHDPLESRGMLPEVTAFGERLACDFIIVSKSAQKDGTTLFFWFATSSAVSFVHFHLDLEAVKTSISISWHFLDRVTINNLP